MKRLIMVLIFVCLLNCLVFSDDNMTANLGISFFFPVLENGNVGGEILASLLLSSFSGGIGYHLNIMENIFSPGIYGDMHFSLLMLLTNGLFSDDGKKQRKKDDTESGFFFFQTGIRLYNRFKNHYFDIEPFVGINFMFGDIGQNILSSYGILIAYKEVGLEYSYQPLLLNNSDFIKRNIHRIVFVLHT